ncbi:MAG: formate dehydrogenase [Thermoproteus sp.]
MSRRLEAICSGDANCVEEVKSAVREIKALFSMEIPQPKLSSEVPPLVDRVENIGEITEAIGDGHLAKLLVAARLAARYGVKFSDWTGDRCPICGNTPSLFLVRPRPGAFFEGREKVAKCVCGFTWRYVWWRCPSCGSEGRENFDVFFKEGLDGVTILRCRRCGFAQVEIQGELDEEDEYGLRILAGYVARR